MGKKAAKHEAVAAAAVDPPVKAEKLANKEYLAEMGRLHAELVTLQAWLKSSGHRVIVVFEGRDAAGKSGAIKAITERVSPRVFRVAALPAPSEREQTQLYLQRYIAHFPAAGEIVLFDRSWYNRAGVERVMGFCTEAECRHFLEMVPRFERALVDEGIQLIKYWFEVSMAEQEARFRERIDDRRKTWKLSPMDIASYQRWYDYSRARDAMLLASDTEHAPWYLVDSDDKRRARLNCVIHLLSLIPYREVPRDKVRLGKRRLKDAYDDRAALRGRRFVAEGF